MVIPDLQIPFHNQRALEFCAYLKKHYRIADDDVLNVGDEVDQLHGGMYPKDPNGHHTASSEIKASQYELAEWAKVFPKMKLAISNHGMRWIKKASMAEIPSQMMRSYQEVLNMPEGWKWAHSWEFKDLKAPFRMIHGMGYSGAQGARNAAIDSGMSTVIGHLHSHAGIAYITTSALRIWGFNAGCLIDPEAYAFSYGKDSRFKPCLGAGVICDSGRIPIWVPID